MVDYKPIKLIDAANMHLSEGSVKIAQVILQFAMQSAILPYLPLRTIAGGSIEVPLQKTLGEVGVRAINEAGVRGNGTTESAYYSLAILNGGIAVDRILEQRMPGTARTVQEMKIQALSLYYDRLFLKGDKTSNPREFNGLQKLTTGSTTQLLAAGNTSGGDALSLSKLDVLKKMVQNPTHWIMDKMLVAKLTTAVRTTSVSGFVNFTQNEFGMEQTTYAGLPIIEVDQDNEANRILDYSEACPGGGSTGSSIYLVSFGDLRVQGIQSGPIQVIDKRYTSDGPILDSEIEWDTGVMVANPRSVARLWGIKDVPIVA